MDNDEPAASAAYQRQTGRFNRVPYVTVMSESSNKSGAPQSSGAGAEKGAIQEQRHAVAWNCEGQACLDGLSRSRGHDGVWLTLITYFGRWEAWEATAAPTADAQCFFTGKIR